MGNLGAKLSYNNYIGARHIRALFKNQGFDVFVKDININGQIRGCSGFLVNKTTQKVCYITTEPFFNGRHGSGLWGDDGKAIMMRPAKSTKDYTGGRNNWVSVKDIVSTAQELTAEDLKLTGW